MNQQQLHDKLLTELMALCMGDIVPQMTLDTFIRTIVDFSASSIVYACEAVNRLDLCDENVISGEIKSMMFGLKAIREAKGDVAKD